MHLDLRDIHILGRGTYQRLVDGAHCAVLAAHGVQFAGLSRCEAGFTWIQRRPARASVLMVLDDAGVGEVLCDGRWQEAGPGLLLLQPAGRSRAWRCRRRWHIAWLDYAPGCEPAHFPVVPSLRPGDGMALADTLRMLWREQLRPEPDPLLLSHAGGLLGIHLRRLIGTEHRHDRLERLWQDIDADLAADWSLSVMAATIGVSMEHLRRLCWQACNESPVARLRRLRMERAAVLLRSATQSVAQSAAAVGYANVAAFSTAFKRHHGQSPSCFAG